MQGIANKTSQALAANMAVAVATAVGTGTP